jgi:hypothetical protein
MLASRSFFAIRIHLHLHLHPMQQIGASTLGQRRVMPVSGGDFAATGCAARCCPVLPQRHIQGIASPHDAPLTP